MSLMLRIGIEMHINLIKHHLSMGRGSDQTMLGVIKGLEEMLEAMMV
jgi:hypothetical protein